MIYQYNFIQFQHNKPILVKIKIYSILNIYVIQYIQLKNISFIRPRARSLLLSLSYSQKISVQQNTQNLPRLPLYVGIGYNVMAGNPLSQHVDPGFLQPVFQFTYNNNQTTEDGRYIVPDDVTSRLVSSCAFTTDVKTYRGTKSYQQSLKQLAKFEAGMQSEFSFSFSLSQSYEKMQKNTIQNSMSYTHALAQCESYKLILNIFSDQALTKNFIQGVNVSYLSNNWATFIQQFGTHYVSQIVLGGRAVQQITYTNQTVSNLASLNISIQIAAKARYAQFFADASFQWSKHQEQISYSQKTASSTTELYVGGAPSRSGNISQWAQNVIKNPMPINYKLSQITQLFQRVKIPQIQMNLQDVKRSFSSAITLYCKNNKCTEPKPDKPNPPPAQIKIIYDQENGVIGGDYAYNFSIINPLIRVQKFIIRCSRYIDNIQMVLTDGTKSIFSPRIGGNGGNQYTWTVPQGQTVTQIQIGSLPFINWMMFITNKGTKSPVFGTNGGTYQQYNFPDGYRIIGFYGRYGVQVNSIGFILGKNYYPPTNQKQLQTKISIQ